MEQLIGLILSIALLIAVIWWAAKIYRAVICVPKMLRVLEEIRDQGHQETGAKPVQAPKQSFPSPSPIVDQVGEWSAQQERSSKFPSI